MFEFTSGALKTFKEKRNGLGKIGRNLFQEDWYAVKTK